MSESHHVHLISDSTGETLNAMARATIAHFNEIKVSLHTTIMVRSSQELENAMAKLRQNPGMVCYTLTDRDLRNRLERECAALSVVSIAPLDPLFARLSDVFGQTPGPGVGLQYQLNSAYFERIAALDFAMAHDDGALSTRLKRADVILTGVSRTSKTPTCIYLAHRGVKAANVPLVPGRDPDPAFFEALADGVPAVGLTANPSRLAQIRSERLETLGDRTPDYAELDQVRTEVTEARLFFDRHAIPVIDVTRRSIEETAAAILATLQTIEGARP
ncbi:MAG: pyruvate, water dikinase regulatory protein [Pseudomonadota bacterium]